MSEKIEFTGYMAKSKKIADMIKHFPKKGTSGERMEVNTVIYHEPKQFGWWDNDKCQPPKKVRITVEVVR